MSGQQFYIKGFDEVRAIAAVAVVVHHVELYQYREGSLNLFVGPLAGFIENLGHNAVMMFFALSGFLITVLLLREKKKRNKIDIKFFYARRAARILPLYLLITLISFLILPNLKNFAPLQKEIFYISLIENIDYRGLILFLLVLPNLALLLGYRIAGLSQAWSIGIEEQFYIFWPWLIDRFTTKTLPFFLIFLFFLKILFLNHIEKYVPLLEGYPIVGNFIRQFALEFMALGGLFGCLYFLNPQFSVKKQTLFLILSTFACLTCLFIQFSIAITATTFSLFLFFIASVGFRPNFLAWVGQRSYGIYMFHPIIIFFLSGTTKSLNLHFSGAKAMLFHALVLITTLLISSFSFTYFEIPIRHQILKIFSKRKVNIVH